MPEEKGLPAIYRRRDDGKRLKDNYIYGDPNKSLGAFSSLVYFGIFCS